MRIGWLDETIEAVRLARQKGLPVLGYTQFPLFTMVDWMYRIKEGTPEDYFMNLGMIEVDPVTYERQWTAVADRFLHHLSSFETMASHAVAD
jgi:beta-glucosidase/6-phospho-beta-glucosidase/beta-galactosidase